MNAREKWESEIKPGKIYGMQDGFNVRIMTVIEGYVVGRRKGCAPFIYSMKDFIQKMQEWNGKK